jgi:hypothetical protein
VFSATSLYLSSPHISLSPVVLDHAILLIRSIYIYIYLGPGDVYGPSLVDYPLFHDLLICPSLGFTRFNDLVTSPPSAFHSTAAERMTLCRATISPMATSA